MLNIIEYPRSKKSYYLDKLSKGRASVKPERNRNEESERSLSFVKKYSSLENDDLRGELRRAMQLLIKKRR